MRLIPAILVLLVACGGGTPALDPAKTSGVEGVPVPQTAVLDASLSSSIGEGYRVPGATFQEVSAWYDRHMPDNQAFGQWAWCQGLTSGDYHSKTYHVPGTARILNVTVANGSADSGGVPGILVGADESGPC